MSNARWNFQSLFQSLFRDCNGFCTRSFPRQNGTFGSFPLAAVWCSILPNAMWNFQSLFCVGSRHSEFLSWHAPMQGGTFSPLLSLFFALVAVSALDHFQGKVELSVLFPWQQFGARFFRTHCGTFSPSSTLEALFVFSRGLLAIILHETHSAEKMNMADYGL